MYENNYGYIEGLALREIRSSKIFSSVKNLSVTSTRIPLRTETYDVKVIGDSGKGSLNLNVIVEVVPLRDTTFDFTINGEINGRPLDKPVRSSYAPISGDWKPHEPSDWKPYVPSTL